MSGGFGGSSKDRLVPQMTTFEPRTFLRRRLGMLRHVLRASSFQAMIPVPTEVGRLILRLSTGKRGHWKSPYIFFPFLTKLVNTNTV